MENQNDLFTQQLETVDSETSVALKNAFSNYMELAKEWAEKAETITVTSITQVKEMQLAREGRLELKKIRTTVEKRRVELKQESLRKGKAIDGMANAIKALITPIEKHLEEQEQFTARLEAKKKQDRLTVRLSELAKFNTDTTFVNILDMPEEQYKDFLINSERKYNEVEAEKKRIETERIDAANAEKERIENQRIENERLRKENAENNKKLETERVEREKAEKELQEIKNAEKPINNGFNNPGFNVIQGQDAPSNNSDIPPDTYSIDLLIDTLTGLNIPRLHEKYNYIMVNSKDMILKVINYLKEESLKL